jgi:rubrerythrin
MMIRKIAFCIIAIILILGCFTLSAVAFDGNDYDGGDSGGGWDSGDSGGSYSSGSGDTGGGTVIASVFIFVIIVVVLVYASKGKTAEKQAGGIRSSSREGLSVLLPDRTALIERIIKEHDPNFSANDFISFVKRVYIDIETAWCKRDMTPVRTLLHDNLYDATVKQVQAKIEQGVVYHYESMVVNTAYLTSYAKDGQFEYLTVYLNARRIDWQEDEKTGRILRGDKTTRWDLRYKMKFMRSAGVLTKEATAGLTEHECPNCGAPLEMTSSAKCPYCDSVITTGQYSWVLSDYGTVRNDTVDEGVRT